MRQREARYNRDDGPHALTHEQQCEQKQQVIVAGHHVLGAEIHEGERVRPGGAGDKGGVLAADGVREDLETRPPVKVQEVEEMQKEVIRVARTLADEGRMIMERGKSADAFL